MHTTQPQPAGRVEATNLNGEFDVPGAFHQCREIAHDLNNAMTPIMAYSESLLRWPDHLENRERTAQYLASMLEAAGKASQLIEQLRQIGRQGEAHARGARVPPVAAPGPAATVLVPSRQQGHNGLRRILVVDDGEQMRDMLTEFLSANGFHVDTASSGAEGLEKLQASHFDALLTDWSMPNMDGSQFAREVKQMSPQLPIIMLTGFGNTGLTEQRPLGVDLVLAKPFSLAQLTQAIEHVTSAQSGNVALHQAG